MKFSLKKRELILIAVLFAIVYAFVAYYFVYTPYWPKVQQDSSDIAELKEQKDKLDSDLANLPNTKLTIKSKNAANERYEEYLMNNTSITDGVDCIEKIAGLMGKEIKDISINKPEEKKLSTLPQTSPEPNTSGYGNNNKNTTPTPQPSSAPTATGGTKGYYAIKIDFKTDLTFNEANELVKFCEGGSRKMTVDKFQLEPVQKDKQASQKVPVPPPQQQEEEKYQVSMSISIYSLNLGNANKLYEYSRNRFNKYNDGNGKPYMKAPTIKNTNPDIASAVPNDNDDKKKILQPIQSRIRLI